MTVRTQRWDPGEPPDRQDLEEKLETEGLSYYSWSNGPGYRYSPHSHSYEKILYVVEGSIVFTLPDAGEQVELLPGDRMDLPAGVEHAALVGPQGVVCLEGHGR